MCVGVYICVCVYRTIFLVMLQHPDLFFSSVMQTVITCEKLKNAPPVLMRHTRCTETFNATVAFLHDSLWFSEKHACPLAFSSYCAILKTINITTLKRHGATSMEAQGLDVGFRNTRKQHTQALLPFHTLERCFRNRALFLQICERTDWTVRDGTKCSAKKKHSYFF